MTIARAYHAVLRLALRKTFRIWQSLGVHVTPNHFYQPIPDTRRLPARLWEEPSKMAGVDLNEAGQLALLGKMRDFKSEYDALPRERGTDPTRFFLRNGSFESVDAEVLYAVLRVHRPARVIEIGSGNSTLLAAQALRENAKSGGAPATLTAIEPYPNAVLQAGAPGVRLLTQRVQDVPLAEFEALGANDVLFIDSSHVLTVGSDVRYEFLEILPRLKPGVLVHVHDVFLPAEYPKDWVLREHRFWNEQYLLQAFLAFNTAFEVIWAGSWMHRTHPGKLKDAFASYDPASVLPGSFWIRRVPHATARA